MKNLYIIIITTIFSLTSFGQDVSNPLTLTPVVFDVTSSNEKISPSVKNALKNKMRSIVTKYGFSSGKYYNNHIIYPDIQILTKDIIPSVPSKVSMNIEITFYIADYDTKTIYASESFEVIGIGRNETKAYKRAFNSLKTNSPKFERLIKNAKEKIINYYVVNCDIILKSASAKHKIGKSKEALSMLTRIPTDCKDCYMKGADLSIEIYKKIENTYCEQNFTKAQSMWATNQSYAGARSIEPYLSRILPSSSCYSNAQKLIADMTKTIKEKENKEWDFMVKKELSKTEFRKKQLELSHEIGMAYLKNRPDITINSFWKE